MEKQDSCNLASPSSLIVPPYSLKGLDGPPTSSSFSRNFASETSSHQGRETWVNGSCGNCVANSKHASIATCAESLRIVVPDSIYRKEDVCGGDTEDKIPSFSPYVTPFINTRMFMVDPSDSTSPNITLVSSACVDAHESMEDDRMSRGSDTNAKLSSFSRAPVQVAFDQEEDFKSISFTHESADYNGNSQQDHVSHERNDCGSPLNHAGIIGYNVTQHLDKGSSDMKSDEITVEAPATGPGRISLRSCKLCGTTKTPLWRSGPLGPKSLCNACGIRSKKARRSEGNYPDCEAVTSCNPTSYRFSARPVKRKLSIEDKEESSKGRSHSKMKRRRWPTVVARRGDSSPATDDEDTVSCLTSSAKFFSRNLIHQLPSSSLMRKQSAAKLALLLEQSRITSVFAKDEEEAAVLLMALSCGLVLA